MARYQQDRTSLGTQFKRLDWRAGLKSGEPNADDAKMSTLTRLVKCNPTVFAEAVENPVGRSSAKLVIEPISSSNLDATLVGHAFDLWVRCWLASRAVIRLDLSSIPGAKNGGAESRAALKSIDKAIRCGSATDERLFRACLTLAPLEAQWRSGRPIERPPDESSTMTELERLVEHADMSWIEKAKSGVNNPCFNILHPTGRLIHADGDLVLDGNLVEIKTARRRNKQMEAWRQLAGYIVLNDMRDEPLSIEHVTVWYVRFKVNWTFPVDAIFKPNGRERLRQFFEDHLNTNKNRVPGWHA